MTHRERWLSTVCDLRTDGLPVRLGESIAGAPRQPGAFRTVMALLSMYADNATGANARPSLRLLQSISHYKYATVHGARGIAITWEHDAHLVFKRAHALGQLFGTPAAHRARVRL